MTHALAATTSRRTLIARTLLAAVTPGLGLALACSAGAIKKGKNTVATVAHRIGNAKDTCELIGGGKMSTVTLPSGTKITYCKGGEHDGTRCKHTSGASSCSCTSTGENGHCSQAVMAPGDSGEEEISSFNSLQTDGAGSKSRKRRRRK